MNYLFHNDDEKIDFNILKKEINLTKYFDETQLGQIAGQVIRGYEIDEASRTDWLDNNRKGMDVAMQKIMTKSHPWPECSNIKFPLIAEAANTYAARTIPEIIQNDQLVKAEDTGEDPDNSQYVRGINVSKCMSYQLLVQSTDWTESLIKLMYCLSVVGTLFKKTYYDPVEKRFMSELCTPDKIVVNNDVSNLMTAERITHIVKRSTNYIIERQRTGIYNEDIDLSWLTDDDKDYDYDAPVELYEQHCWWDFDNDGYKEPYIIIVHKPSGKVLRIVNRFESVETDKNKIIKITAEQYFIDYHFIRAFDGSYYSIGFGTYLLPLNEAASSLINQLIDAGTLSTTQAGFFSKDIRIREGEIGFKQGRWKILDAAAGTDLNKAIYPLPAKDPSPVLFQLLQLIVQTCKDLASTTDVMQGRQPAQNVANSTVSALLEQGNKSFVAINKGVFGSLSREFVRLYKINAKHLSNEEYRKILNNPNVDVKKDFDLTNINIRPVADPNLSSQSQRLQKAMVITGMPTADKRQADLFMASAMQLDNSWVKMLFPPPNPNAPPPPEQQKIMAESQLLQAQAQEVIAGIQHESEKNQIAAQKLQIQMQQVEAFVKESMARISKMMADSANNQAKTALVSRKLDDTANKDVANFEHKKLKDYAEIGIKQGDLQLKAAQTGMEGNLATEKLKIEKDQQQLDSQKNINNENKKKDEGENV